MCNMDDNFLMDFDIVDPPVFAKKSAPPPPVEDSDSKNVDDSIISTPSSSLLDTTNDENSLFNANSANPSSANSSRSRIPSNHQKQQQQQQQHQHSSPMDLDTPLPPPPNLEDPETPTSSSTSSKTRSRCRTKKGDKPDVQKLLDSLESGDLPPPPPLPNEEPSTLPPLPPLPPPNESGHVGSVEPAETDVHGPVRGSKKQKKKQKPKEDVKSQSAKASASKGEKEKRKSASAANADLTNKSSSSQRTSARIPKIKQTPEFPSHNRQWLAEHANSAAARALDTGHGLPLSDGSSAAGVQGATAPPDEQPSSSAGSDGVNKNFHGDNNGPTIGGSTANSNPNTSYGRKQQRPETVCLDISSFRFIPDDDQRVAILLRKMKGDGPCRGDASLPSSQVVLHQFPTIFSNDVTGIPLEEAPGASTLCATSDNFLILTDFASVEVADPPVYHTIPRRDSIVFILVHREVGKRGKIAWDVPTLLQCQDFTNAFISMVYEGDDLHQWSKAYVRSGRWGKVGTMLLSSDSIEDLSELRRQIALWPYRGFAYDTFPKDVLTTKADVSILLRASMKTFNTEMIPKVLFARNQDAIAGSLRILSTKFFGAEERSHKGDSKEHWRSVDLKGCDQFMRCLRFIPESFPFLLGFDAVQIKGGLRPAESNQAVVTGSKRSWDSIAPPPVLLLLDPRNIVPSGSLPDENATRGAAKRGRNFRGARRGHRGKRGRNA